MSAFSAYRQELVVYVRTGDHQGADTDANIAIILHDRHGASTEKIYLDNFFRNDFEKGNLDVFPLDNKKTSHLTRVERLEIFRDESGSDSSWYVERITVEDRSSGDVHVFPVFRWIRPHYHYMLRENDVSLPQHDELQEQRRLDLEDKRKTYTIDMTDLTFPALVTDLPPDEAFSRTYSDNLADTKDALVRQATISTIFSGKWKTLEDIRSVYVNDSFYEPLAIKYWREDWYFGFQRLNGICPVLIQLCTDIPLTMTVDESKLSPLLEGKSLSEAMCGKRIFIIDLQILHNFKTDVEAELCAPILLLYRKNNDQLVPVALQLYQEPGPENPVFYPTDDKNLWLLAKMWYAHAESTFHQGLAHLGYTHMYVEGIHIALQRNVSVCHPVFKLLAPHLMYLLAINRLAFKLLLTEGGWVDSTMSAESAGVKQLIRLGQDEFYWRMDVQGTLPEDLKKRGVLEKDVLPNYYYRDDALMIYDVINKFVTNYVRLYYTSKEALLKDHEIQGFAADLVRSRADGGIGMLGVPGNGNLTNLDDLVHILSYTIFTSSVQHAAVNFPQYDCYGFPPAFPLTLRGKPPKDKKPRTEADLLESLPEKKRTFSAMTITKVLSMRAAKPLGDYEVQYIVDAKAKSVLEQFQDDLLVIGEKIVARNKELLIPYDYLHPKAIPNSIST